MKKGLYISIFLLFFACIHHINAITSAQASKMLQDAEKAKEEITAESQTVFQMLQQDITKMNASELTVWKEKLRDTLRRLNKDANIIVGTPLVLPEGTPIPPQITEIPKEVTTQIAPPSYMPEPPTIPSEVPAPTYIPQPPVFVHEPEHMEDWKNTLKNIKSFAKRTPMARNIGTFDFSEWFKEIDSVKNEIKTVTLTADQKTTIETLIKDTETLVVNTCTQWIVAYFGVEFSGAQAPFHVYFIMIQNWINTPNKEQSKKMIAVGSEFDKEKDTIKAKITNLATEINNNLSFIIKHSSLLTTENRELVFSKILEYIYGTFKTDTVPGKANIDRSLYAIVQEAIKYINYAFATNPTAEETKEVIVFDDSIISPIMLTFFLMQKTIMASNIFDKNKITSIYNLIKQNIQLQRENIEKRFGYHEEW